MHHDRYVVPSDDEDYEPGSNEEVLKNLLGIKEKQLINQLEEQELIRAGNQLPTLYDIDYQFNTDDVCDIHFRCGLQIFIHLQGNIELS